MTPNMTSGTFIGQDGQASCRSVRHAFRLLELLAGSPDGLRLARLVDATGLPKSSVHRILGTLEELDVICRDDTSAAYHLTAAWRRIVVPPRLTEFSAPVRGNDGRPVAGLTLRLRGQVSPGAPSERLTRLVADLAHAVSSRLRDPRVQRPEPASPTLATRESNLQNPRVRRSRPAGR
ncbi:MAG: helix-turn-helix domain-containing protein [Actinophytocola sp.]|uniref:helix-turn-helix domain-containing protein n=1 Tax=Actinophytocola sp. TaxID=1872138 RepID=UPI001327FB22|nr:helix-turn-helix domain-containing protein [Actinophytocola sp.]MPZ84636.1 helix-turn-helix domain-containing protein [Actinophytocola sp.]